MLLVIVGCAILIGGLSLVDLTVAPGRPTPTFMTTLPMCPSGAVTLTEEWCELTGPCERKGMRVEWSRDDATLSAIDGETQREVTQLNASRLRMLLDDLAALTPLDSDAGERDCSPSEESEDFCPLPRHTFGLRATCSGQAIDHHFTRSSFSQRIESAKRSCLYFFSGWQRSTCLAESVFKATFATGYRQRLPRMIKRMEAIEP